MPLKDPVAKAAYQREYSRRNRDRLNAYTAAWRRDRYANDPEYREKVKAAASAAPNVVKAAQQRVYKALRRGEISRPERCEDCAATGYVEAAHINYTDRLAIRWLCRPCHRAWDATAPKSLAVVS